MELVETAQNSAGRSDEQFAKYADTITYKTNQIKNSWEELRLNFMDSDTYKKGLDIVNKIINSFKKVNPTVLLGDLAIFGLIGKQIVTNIIISLKTETPRLQKAFSDIMSNLSAKEDPISKVVGKWTDNSIKKFAEKAHFKIDENNIKMPNVQAVANKLIPLAETRTNINNIEKEIKKKIGNAYEDVKKASANTAEIQRQKEQEIQKIINSQAQTKRSVNNLTSEQVLKLAELKQQNDSLSQKDLAKLAVEQKILQTQNDITGVKLKELNQINEINAKEEEAIIVENQKKQLYNEQKQNVQELDNLLTQQQIEEQNILTFLTEQGYNVERLKGLTGEELRQEAQRLLTEQKITEEKRRQFSILGQSLKSGIAFGLTTGITTLVSTRDMQMALTAGITTLATSMLPAIINFIIDLIVKALAAVSLTIAASIAATVAIIAGIAFAIWYNSAEQKYERKMKELKKEAEQIQNEINEKNDKIQQHKEKMDEYKDEEKALEEIKQISEEYGNQTIHSLEEQEEYNKKMQEYQEQFPNLIELQNNKYIIQNSLLDEQIEKLKEKKQLESIEATGTMIEVEEDKKDTAKNQLNQNLISLDENGRKLDELVGHIYGKYYSSSEGTEKTITNYKNMIEAIKQTYELDENAGLDFYDIFKFSIKDLTEEKLNKMKPEDVDAAYTNFYNAYKQTAVDTRQSFFTDYGNQLKDANNAEIEDLKLHFSQMGKISSDWTEILANSVLETSDFLNNPTAGLKSYDEEIKDFIPVMENFSELEPLTKNEVDSLSTFLKDEIEPTDGLSENGQKALELIKKNKDRYEEYIESFISNYDQGFDEIDNTFKDLFTDKSGKSFLNFKFDSSQYTQEELNNAYDSINKFITSMGDSPETREAIASLFENLPEEVQKKLPEVLGALNINNLDATTLKSVKDSFIDLVSFDKTDSSLVFDEIISGLQDLNAISLVPQDEEKWNEYFNNIKDERKEILENEDMAILAFSAEGTEIDRDQLNTLIEWSNQMGLSYKNFYDESNKQLKNVEKLKEEYKNYWMSDLNELEELSETIANGHEAELLKYDELIKQQNSGVELNKEDQKWLEEHEATLEQIYPIWAQINGYIEEQTDLINNENKLLKAVADAAKERYENIKKAKEDYEAADEALAKAQQERDEKIAKAQKDIVDQEQQMMKDKQEGIEKIQQAQEDLIKKEKELDEALYGTSNYLSDRDPLSNYTEKIERLSKAVERAKTALENSNADTDIKQLIQNYGEVIHQQAVYQEALNQKNTARKNIIFEQLKGYGEEYFKIDPDGFLQENKAAITTMQRNDEFKKDTEKLIEEYNKLQEEIIEGEEKFNKVLKEMEEKRKSALNDVVSLQKDTAEILKKSYEEEVKNVKEKYDAIKEADDNYLSALEDAINKQKQLRDEESKWDSLAEKEKKLSLIERDTSGSQQKEVLKQQQDIEKERQSLLDNSISNIVNTLKETYEAQQKEREEEIAFQEKLIEDMDFMKQAMEILSGMSNNEEYLSWLMENNPDFQNMSDLEQQQYINEHENDFSKIETYNALQEMSFEEYLQIAAEEVNEVMANTSDNLQEYLEISHQNVIDKITEEQDKAREAVEDAQEKLNEAYIDYDEKMTEGEQKLTELRDALAETTNSEIENVKKAEEAREEAMNACTTLGINNVKDMSNVVDEAYSDWMGKYETFLKTSMETESTRTMAMNAANNKLLGIDKDITDAINSGANNESIANLQYDRSIYINSILNDDEHDFLEWDNEKFQFRRKYATGGLVDYTGPAWVDGTPTRPEAFLSAEDTARIGAAAQLLSNIPALNSSSITDNSYSSNIGDTTIEVHINVESISSELDIDEAVKRVEDDIVEMSNLIGNPVLLNK